MRFFRWLRNLFKSKPVQVPPGVDKPVDVVDSPPPTKVNHGDWQRPDFGYLWSTMVIDTNRLPELENFKALAVQNAKRYMTVSKRVFGTTDIWKLIAALFHRECSQNFSRCLHNGDPWDRKTVNDPAGRGPFSSWEDSAVDALLLEKAKWPYSWHNESMLEFAEKFNGLGYRRRGYEYSPYVWAATNHHDETGKYRYDGNYSSSAPEKQLGVAAMLKMLEDVTIQYDIPEEGPDSSYGNVREETPWYALAEKYLGVSESNPEDRKTIAQFHKEAGANDDYRVPWCASFVTYCLNKTGYISTNGQWARDYLNLGFETMKKPHCIMVFERNGIGGDSHVTFWTGRETATSYECLGGNQGEAVSKASYSKAKLLGCFWPEKRPVK